MRGSLEKHNTNQQGITEVLGTMLLLFISIVLFSVVYLSVMNFPMTITNPHVNILGSLDTTGENHSIIFHHIGGDSIPGNNQIIIHNGNSTDISSLNYYIGEKWEVGETFSIPIKNINNTYIDAMIIDTQRNSIISNMILQKK